MTLQSSGTISMSDIINEFGATRNTSSQPNNTRLGDYRKVNSNPNNGNHSFSNYPHEIGELSFGSLDSRGNSGNIPTSGRIAFSDFHGRKLQQVVNFHSSGAGGTRLNAYERYDENGEIGSSAAVLCVGNHKTRPQNSNGTRVHIHVNKTIGSEKNEVEDCALRTGSGWGSRTELRIDVGGEGRIQGAGGNGGRGSKKSGGGGDGKTGTSGLGIQYGNNDFETKVSIASGGIIRCGYGGGGGGGGGYDTDFKSVKESSGGGGGGGAGIPAGNGGAKGTGAKEANGAAGEEGTANEGGTGAPAVFSGEQESKGGEGGNGGDTENVNAENGENGVGGEESGGLGGTAGGNGAAIRRTNSNIKFEMEEGSSIPSSSGSINAEEVG